jgi:hypothetical protein
MFRKLVVQIEGRRSVSNLNICFRLVATPLMNYARKHRKHNKIKVSVKKIV